MGIELVANSSSIVKHVTNWVHQWGLDEENERPNVYDEYVLKAIVVEGIMQSSRHSMCFYCSRRQMAHLQKKVGVFCNAIEQTQAAWRPGQQPRTHMNNQGQSKNRRPNLRQGPIDNLELQSRKAPIRWNIEHWVDVAAVTDVSETPTINFISKMINKLSIESVDKWTYCRACLLPNA